MSYVTETNYTGELAKFPGLYDIEFKKSNAYISNKDFSKEHQDIFMICEESATDFYDTLFNVDYRDIVEDKNAFVANVMKNCDYGSYHIKNYGLETEETEYLFEYIMDIADYFVENQVEMTAKFYTDDSMVYSDYYTFVRGALCFTIFENNDNNSEYKKGIEYVIPMEVSMERATFDSSIRVITSFGKAEDKTFFLSE